MSQFPIDEQLVKRADYAYNPRPLLEAELATLHASNAGQGAEIGKLREQVLELRVALSLLLACHLELVNSGVCGGWDPEGDIEVQSARTALAATEPKP